MDKNNVKISVKDFGSIEIELYPNSAPITVANFKKLVASKYYNGSTFHRIIKGFMIQGGSGITSLDPIYGEFASNGFKNELKHERGVISMARTMVKDSATSQFFIMHQDSPHLDGEYAAFGKVTKGIEVVDLIANVKTGYADEPITKIIIEKVEFI